MWSSASVVNLRNDPAGYTYRDASTTHKNSEPCRS
jgi:hypothetical protein